MGQIGPQKEGTIAYLVWGLTKLLPWSLDPLGAQPHCLKPYFQGSPWSRDSQAESPWSPGAVLIAQALLLQYLEFPWPSPRSATLILGLGQRKSVLA